MTDVRETGRKPTVVSENSAMCDGAEGRGQSLSSVQLCFSLLKGNAAETEEHPWGRWKYPEQCLPGNPLVSGAPPGLEK